MKRSVITLTLVMLILVIAGTAAVAADNGFTATCNGEYAMDHWIGGGETAYKIYAPYEGTATAEVYAACAEGSLSYVWEDGAGEDGTYDETGPSMTFENITRHLAPRCTVTDMYGNEAVFQFDIMPEDFLIESTVDLLVNNVLYETVASGEACVIPVSLGDSISVAVHPESDHVLPDFDFSVSGAPEYTADDNVCTVESVTGSVHIRCFAELGPDSAYIGDFSFEIGNGLTVSAVGDTLRQAAAGDSVTLAVTAAAASGDLAFSWQDAEYNEPLGDDQSSLTFTADQSGSYKCTVSDRYGSKRTVEFMVLVSSPQEISVGQSMALPLEGSGVCCLSFTPSETGAYLLTSTGSTGPELSVYRNGQRVGSDPFSRNERHFHMEMQMDAGETYIYYISYRNSPAVAVHLTRAERRYGDFTYAIEDGSAVITGYTGSETWIDIPEAINGHPVTAIASMTGDPQTADVIEYVRIPDGVTVIRDAAFANMTSLDGVRLPNTLSAIGDDAFSGCSLIESMEIPQSVTGIGAHAFDGCNGGTGILLRVRKDSYAYQFAAANGIRTRSYAFYPASAALPEATAPRDADVLTWTYVHPTEADYLRITFSADSVLADGDQLLFGTQRDETIDAFYYDAMYTGSQVSGLVVALPTGEDNRSFQMQLSSDTETSASTIRVTDISAISLEEYMMPIYQVDHGVIMAVSAYAYNSYDEEGPEPLIVPAVCDGQTITGIGAHAFSSLVYGGYWIQLPDSVTTIGDHAFDGCMNLETIGLPAHLQTIGDYAFYYTWLGGSLVLPNGLESIGSYAFAYNTPLESIAIPASVTYIGEHAFDRADDDTTSIPLKVVPYSYAQQYAEDHGIPFELYTPQDFTYAVEDGQAVITGYTGTREYIQVPNTIDGYPVTAVTGIDSAAYDKTRLEGIHLPQGLTCIGDAVFEGCTSLWSVDLPDSLTSIGSRAFYGCTGLYQIAVPDSVNAIGDDAFGGCSNVILLVVPDSYAHQYAVANGISCHTVIHHPASGDLPESSHPCSPVYEETWTYVYPGEAAYLRISFSADSQIADQDTLTISQYSYVEDTGEYSTAVLSQYFGRQLGGLTVCVPNDDGVVFGLYARSSAYGFRVTAIEPATAEEYSQPRYIVENGTLIAASNLYSPMTIPEVIDGQTITGIGPYALASNLYQRSITMPDTVTTIGENALGGIMLSHIGLPKNLKTIGDSAFAYCDLGRDGPIVIPDGTETIGSYAFAYNESLTAVVIPASVTSIGVHAFDPSEWAEEPVTLHVVSGSYAHQYAVQYGVPFELYAPQEGSFTCDIDDGRAIITGYTGSGSVITIPSEIDGYPVTGIASLGGDPIDPTPAAGMTHITIPEGVTWLGENALAFCRALESVDVPESLTSIGSFAFSGCSQLTGITIPKGVSSIGTNVFDGCESLADITAASDNAHFFSLNGILYDHTMTAVIACPPAMTGSLSVPGNVTTISDGAFSGSRLTQISISAGMTSIGNWAFYNSSITGMNLPDTVSVIGDNAFGNCYGLTGFTVPNGVSSLGRGTFEFCENLTSVDLPAFLTGIGDSAFNGCIGLAAVNYAGNVEDVPQITIGAYNGPLLAADWTCADGVYSFSFEGTLGDDFAWTYSNHVLTIAGDGALVRDGEPWNGFENGIQTIVLQGNITSIGDQVFSGLFELTDISIPDTVTAIGDSAFSWCTGLVSIDIPASVTGIGDRAFSDCFSLLNINVADGNTAYASPDGVLFNKALSELIVYPQGRAGAYTVPDTVTAIRDSAFCDCYDLTAITLPDALVSIGSNAFYRCAFDRIVIPQGVTAIGDWAFDECRNLVSVTIPAGVTEIGSEAFHSCHDSLILSVREGSYAHQYAVENELAFELVSGPAGQMILTDGAGEPIENARIDRTYYGDCGYYFLEGTPVASIANYDELKQGRETEPVFAYEWISGPDDLSIWFDGGRTPYVYFNFDLAEEDAPADVVYRCSFAWDDMEPAVFDLYFHLKNPPMGPYEGVALDPPSVDMLPGQSFTVSASWLPEGWGIEGETTWMECMIENWPDEEEYPLKHVSKDGTTLTATIDSPGYYTVSMWLHTSLNNYVNYAHITVRNPDGSLPVLIPNIYEVPYEMMAAEGTAENPYYIDCPGNSVGYLSADNGWYFAEYGQEDPWLAVTKTETDAPDLTAVPNADKPSAFDIYLGDPENPVIPAGAAGDWHYTLTLWWGSESSSVSVSLHVEGMPAVFTLPAGLTAIEAEAFRGVQADVFVIPENVTSIDPSAFDPGVRLMVAQGSYAESFAVANGFAYDYSD